MKSEYCVDFPVMMAGYAAKRAQAAAVGVCLIALLLLAMLWLSGLGLKWLWRSATAPAYPDPVCEVCGLTLDGSNPVCLPPSSFIPHPSSFSFGNGPDSSLAAAKPVPGMAAAANAGARGRGVLVTPTVTR